MGSADGVFRTKATSDNACQSTSPRDQISYTDGISLDLSRASAIYSGSSLQPKALQTLACIRT